MHAHLLRGRTCVAFVWALVATAGTASWPQSQAPETQKSTLVAVDFRVVTHDGTPIRDLRREEIALKVGRRQREIVALQLVQLDAALRPAAPDAPPPPYLTNAAAAGGRDVFLVVDDEGIQASRTKPVADLLTRLLDQFAAADRVGWTVPRDVRAGVTLTDRRDAIRAAIGRLTGRAPVTESEAEALCRTRRNLDTLVSVFRSAVPSVPSVVVFLSNGFSPPAAVEPVNRAQALIGPCEIRTRDMEDLERAATASRAQVFGVEVVDDTVSAAAPAGDLRGGFEHVAGLSGNAVIRLTGNEVSGVKRIAVETSAYYVAAFEAAPDEQNGSPQRVEVAVARPGVTVRAWPTVVVPKAGRDAASAPAKVRDMLPVSRVFTDLPLRASVHTSRATGNGRLKVVCMFESSESGTPLAEASLALFDDKGTARAQWTGQRDALKQMPVLVSINAPPPGVYRVRVAARDASGNAGTIDHNVVVDPPAKGAVTLGALVFGTEGKSGFAPLLQFTSEPVALGVVEIYGAQKTANVTAAFELAASETSRALAVLQGRVQTVNDDVRIASMAFPIKDMPPGDVMVRAVVTVDGKPLDAKAVRTLRKAER